MKGLYESNELRLLYSSLSMLSKYARTLMATAGLLGSVTAQDEASSTTLTAPEPGVTPTGNYTGQYRPQVHFSPPVVCPEQEG
jgi:hypothetical protein